MRICNILVLLLVFHINGLASGMVEQNNQIPKRYSIVTSDDFLKDFERTGQIGNGAQAVVYSVKDRSNHKTYALVVRKEMRLVQSPDDRREFIERMIKNQDVNPHQAKIYGYFWIKNPNYPWNGKKERVNSFGDIQEGRLFNETYLNDPDATPYCHEAILMEQGIADLESKQFKVLSMDENHLHLFDEICSRSLDRARIFSFDNEDRNWVFVCIEGQTYLGEALAKYDYWCYRMSDLCIYIPRLSHIIKRIDYAQWLEKDWCLNPDKENILNRLARKCGVTRDQFLTRYCTKPEGANIRILYLDISGDMDR